MKKLSRIATAAAIIVCLPAGVLLAQGTTTTETPAAAAPAPAASPAPAATTPATAPQATTTDKDTGKAKKKSGKKMTTRQEVDKSVESGTVPSRYRSSVPKEYQQYVPFAK